jgi:hypothetical protein
MQLPARHGAPGTTQADIVSVTAIRQIQDLNDRSTTGWGGYIIKGMGSLLTT